MVVDSNFMRSAASLASARASSASPKSPKVISPHPGQCLALYRYVWLAASARCACRLMHTGQYTEAGGPDGIFKPHTISGDSVRWPIKAVLSLFRGIAGFI